MGFMVPGVTCCHVMYLNSKEGIQKDELTSEEFGKSQLQKNAYRQLSARADVEKKGPIFPYQRQRSRKKQTHFGGESNNTNLWQF